MVGQPTWELGFRWGRSRWFLRRPGDVGGRDNAELILYPRLFLHHHLEPDALGVETHLVFDFVLEVRDSVLGP